MRRFSRTAFAALALFAALLPGLATADGSWLDQPLSNWNLAGMDVPLAPPMDPATNARCLTQRRPPETDADQTVADAGWILFGGYNGGWSTYVVRALSGYDGMCRPLGFNEFVFVDGQFAGTISPDTMNSRTDGVGDIQAFSTRDAMSGLFYRYASTDPLCCPSGSASVFYQVDRTKEGPVLVPQGVSVTP